MNFHCQFTYFSEIKLNATIYKLEVLNLFSALFSVFKTIFKGFIASKEQK